VHFPAQQTVSIDHPMGGNIGKGMASVHGVTNGSGAAGVSQKRSNCAVRRYFAWRYLSNNFPNLLKKVGI
jgi:hypothetical protein